MSKLIEVCANSAESSVAAEKGGAYRVELCAAIPEGGTTPSYGEMVVTRKSIGIKMNVIIRPRAGDFLYSDMEFKAMKEDIMAARKAGADGVVFGCLTEDGEIDMEKNRELIKCAEGLSTTFHRAFDVCRDPIVALEQIIELGFDRILTSGQKPSAPEGADLIAKLVEKAAGRIIIMPGCGVNETNVRALAAKTGATEFHMSARENIPSGMKYRKEGVSMGGEVKIDEFLRPLTTARRVAQSLKELNG